MPFARSRMFLMFLSTLMCVTSLGCNVVRVTLNAPLTQDDVAFIVPGHTRLTEVIAKLGAPDSITDSQTGIVASYSFLDMKYSRVNFGWLVKPWTPVDPDLIISRTGLGVDALQVICDSQWVVMHQGFLPIALHIRTLTSRLRLISRPTRTQSFSNETSFAPSASDSSS
ncbi:MAG: hypothetical protein HY038_09135 [Nitrospirae bacterium]|nr:hypothetical protein [Nitrospirota bacterium]